MQASPPIRAHLEEVTNLEEGPTLEVRKSNTDPNAYSKYYHLEICPKSLFRRLVWLISVH